MTAAEEKQLTALLRDPKTQRQGFEKLVRAYGEQLYWQVRRIVLTHEDANDVVQNVLLKAWTNLDSFRNDARISTWLYRIAANESLDFLRRQKNVSQLSADEPEGFVANQLMADPYFDGDQTEALLQEAIAQLPDVQRMVFHLRYYDNMKYSDISQMLHTSEGALKASYHIAVKKIADFFHRRD